MVVPFFLEELSKSRIKAYFWLPFPPSKKNNDLLMDIFTSWTRVVQYCRPESSRIPLHSIGKPEVYWCKVLPSVLDALDTNRFRWKSSFSIRERLRKIPLMLDEGVESRSDGVHRIHWKRIDSDGKVHFLFVRDLDNSPPVV